MPIDVIRQFPHCDSQVLHEPGVCEYCDEHPEWQQLREMWGINFTGQNDNDKIPCPSTRRRPLNSVHAWGGNRPKPHGHDDVEPPPASPLASPPAKSVYDRLREDPFKGE